jgi:hypothetical protein
MLNRKIIGLAVTLLFVLSAFSCAVQASVQCPKCHGTGQITSQVCSTCGGSGQLQPNVTKGGIQLGESKTQTNMSSVFHNAESVDVYAVVTATINTQKEILTKTSNRTMLKANSDTLILLTFEGLKDENYFVHYIDIAVEPITCPTCNGTGAGSLITCTQCGGTGYISEAAAAGGFDFSALALPALGIAVVAVASAAGVFIIRTKRVNEEKLRSFTSSEFNTWVLGRLRGAEASVLDSRKGIDGFTGDGAAVIAKQTDNVSKAQIDITLNSLMQAKARSGIFVAFSFASDASAAVTRGRINYHIDLKLVTIKELLRNKEPILL